MAKVEKGCYDFLIDRDTYSDFALLCQELGYVRSKRLENYMKQFIEDNKARVQR